MITPEQIAEEAAKVTQKQYETALAAEMLPGVWHEFAAIADGRLLEREEQAKRIAELERDAARYQGLRALAKEEPLNPKQFSHPDCPDTRCKWTLPVLVSWADYCGQITFDEAVDMALPDAAIDAELAKGK